MSQTNTGTDLMIAHLATERLDLILSVASSVRCASEHSGACKHIFPFRVGVFEANRCDHETPSKKPYMRDAHTLI